MTTDAVRLNHELFVPAARWHRSLAIVLTAGTLATAVATVMGSAPWLFLAVFGVTGTYLLAPTAGWGRAAWATAAIALFATSWILVVDPYLDVRMDVATVAVLSVAIVAGLVWRWIKHGRTPRPVPSLGVFATLAMVLPAAGTAAIYYGASALKGMPLTWAMQGDAQFNTVLSRQFAVANGELAGTSQVLSLAQGLMAIVHLPGREKVAVDLLLMHDISRQANLWVLMILLSSVLAGSIADRVLRGGPAPLRYFGIVGSAVLPLTWHLTGYAMSSGFYNVSIAFFTIELAFFFWLAIPRSALLCSAVMLGLTVVMLGAWTPMAIIPAALAGGSAWQGFRNPRSRLAMATWVAAAAQLAVFVALFVLPGFIAKSAVLSVTGTILPLSRFLYLAITVAALFVAVAVGTGRRGSSALGHRHFAVGTALMAGSAALGTGFLIFQNRHLPDYWIYYPIKFAWISMEMLILLVFLGACLIVSTMKGERMLAASAAVSTVVILLAVLQQNPPPPTSATFPLVGVVKNGSPADVTLPLLSSISGQRVFFYWYMKPEQDTFMNQWQFQITAKDEFTPIREFAYRGVNSILDACDAAKAWGGDVEVVTSSELTAASLTEKCGSLLTAVVRAPLG